MTNLNSDVTTTETTTSAIETALALAKSAKTESKRVRLTDEEKAERTAQRDADRLARATARAEKKAAKSAEKDSVKAEKAAIREAKKAEKAARPAKVPHLARLEKNVRLPDITPELAELVNQVSALSAPEISAVIAHVQKNYRAKQIVASNDLEVNVGDTVKIVSGNSDVLGLIGIVSDVHRIRAYVEVPGTERPVYVYLADLEGCEPESTVSVDVTAEAV